MFSSLLVHLCYSPQIHKWRRTFVLTGEFGLYQRESKDPAPPPPLPKLTFGMGKYLREISFTGRCSGFVHYFRDVPAWGTDITEAQKKT